MFSFKDSSTSDDCPSAPVHPLLRSHSVNSNLLRQQSQILETLTSISERQKDLNLNENLENADSTDDINSNHELDDADKTGQSGDGSSDNDSNNNCNNNEKSVNLDDHNRTMVLQVDRTDLRLISPDRKIILLNKQHKDITTCVQVRTKNTHTLI